ncbi:MAG: DUF6544 family protein [Dermatophilaceae bacterium]
MDAQDHAGWSLADWRHRLRNGPATADVFTSAELEGLDDPVRAHLGQAIVPGASLAQCAQITMRGSIKIGRWLPFRARQILRPHDGFIWAARVAGVIAGSDRYLDGIGGMQWKLAGLVNVAKADGPDVSRSAAGRCGAEGIWLPTALLPRFGVRWSAQDSNHITAHYLVGDTPIEARCQVGPDGHLRSVTFERWGDPDQTGQWGWHTFGGTFTAQRTFAGLSIPSSGRMGWHYGTDRWESGEFFRYQITDLQPLAPDGECDP